MTRRGAAAVALLAGIASLALPAATATGGPVRSAPPRAVAPQAGNSATGVVPDDLADRYLAHRPTLGPTTVVQISGEPDDRRLLAATLQGIVNRTEARIYLVGARAAAEDQRWLDRYVADGLVSVAGTTDLGGALAEFASEAAGYVLADPAEPWTINTATTAAGALGAVVATPSTKAALDTAGLTMLADHRGRWPDAASAYEAMAAAYADDLDLGALAIQQPERHQPRDLFVQQGMLVAYTRPSQPDASRVYALLDEVPADVPVYGYVSDTGAEEVDALVRLSQQGRFLIPTDTTDNLSFHLAVAASEPRQRPAPRPDDEAAPCQAEDVNVVVAFSDGDNLVVPEAKFPGAAGWDHPDRGDLPVGWGISPAAAILMPAIWDRYVSTATDADEVVDMMGLGYALPSLMPDGAGFLADGMRLRAALGVSTTWSLDALITDPAADGWADWAAAARTTAAAPAGLLLNYARWPGPAWHRRPDGMAVLASQQGSYDDDANDLAAQVRSLQAAPPDERPLVAFLPATIWQTSYADLLTQLRLLADEGVRFLTPAEAVACLPEPVAPTTTTTAPTGPANEPPPEATPVTAAPTYVG